MDIVNAGISPDIYNPTKKTDVSPDTYNTAKKTGTNTAKCGTSFKSSNVLDKGVDIVLVAASTGGPVTLERLFTGFKESPGIPLLVVQHMPSDFTRVLADSLSKKTNLCFAEGKEGDILKIGQCIVAPGGYHMMGLSSAMMCGMPIESVGEMERSALAELANMITGNAVSSINDVKDIDISPPSVVMGQDMFFVIGTIAAMSVNLETSVGVIEVNLGLEV